MKFDLLLYFFIINNINSSRYENNSPPSAIGNGILERTDDKDERGTTNVNMIYFQK